MAGEPFFGMVLLKPGRLSDPERDSLKLSLGAAWVLSAPGQGLCILQSSPPHAEDAVICGTMAV